MYVYLIQNQQSGTVVDGEIDDWDEALLSPDQDLEPAVNPSIDIIQYSARTDSVYLSALTITSGIPEFSSIMMPIVSVLAIVSFNYRRRKINQDE